MSQRIGLVWPRPFLARPWFRRLTTIVLEGVEGRRWRARREKEKALDAQRAQKRAALGKSSKLALRQCSKPGVRTWLYTSSRQNLPLARAVSSFALARALSCIDHVEVEYLVNRPLTNSRSRQNKYTTYTHIDIWAIQIFVVLPLCVLVYSSIRAPCAVGTDQWPTRSISYSRRFTANYSSNSTQETARFRYHGAPYKTSALSIASKQYAVVSNPQLLLLRQQRQSQTAAQRSTRLLLDHILTATVRHHSSAPQPMTTCSCVSNASRLRSVRRRKRADRANPRCLPAVVWTSCWRFWSLRHPRHHSRTNNKSNNYYARRNLKRFSLKPKALTLKSTLRGSTFMVLSHVRVALCVALIGPSLIYARDQVW